ncbi:MAG: SOS response-associated peptidase [Proteobacteria bacterium]|nr:SOS response-associated peptidase [Pseudomonadota bacterium]
MCGRFALKAPPAELVTYFALDECEDFKPRFNIPPTVKIPAIRQTPEGRRVLNLLRWGLVPFWAKDLSIGNKLNNARGETVAEKPSFRSAFKARRCLVPASGFYEWKTENKIKQPYYISLKSGDPMAFAGIWESWTSKESGEIVDTVCIVTTGPNEIMAPIHDRMPVILGPDHWQSWLTAPVEEVKARVASYPAEEMQAWPVSRRVSRAGEEGAELIEAI